MGKHVSRAIWGILLLFSVFAANALPLCVQQTSSCVDATPCKNINGYTACLAGVTPPAGGFRAPFSCWQTSKTYNCNLAHIDTCDPTPSTCVQNGETCSQTDPATGSCMLYTRTYSCQSVISAPASNSCGTQPTAPGCVQQAATCSSTDTFPYVANDGPFGPLEMAANGNIPALNVTASLNGSSWSSGVLSGTYAANPNLGTCLAKQQNYLCSTPSNNSTCSPMNPVGCALTSSGVCLTTDPNTGACSTYQEKYFCTNVVGPQPTQTQTVSSTSCSSAITPSCTIQSKTCLSPLGAPLSSCSQTSTSYSCPVIANVAAPGQSCISQTCSGQACYGVNDQKNTAFGAAVGAMEVARQAGAYFDPATMTVFKGDPYHCSDSLVGMFNCCISQQTSGGSNAQMVAGFVAQQGISSLFSQGVAGLGSQFAYDALLTDSPMASSVLAGASSVISAVTGGAFGAAAGAAAATGSTTMSFLGVQATLTVGPGGMAASLAPCVPCLAAVVVMVVLQYLFACNQEEQKLAVIRGHDLCQYVGPYCSMSLPFGICLQYTTGFCCYNSKFALMVNQQGRPQIGKTWGSPQSPDCSGFTIPQLGQLNFSSMNLTAAFTGMQTAAQNPALLTANVTNTIAGYYQNAPAGTVATQSQISAMSVGSRVAPPVTTATTGGGPTMPSSTTPPMACTPMWGTKVPSAQNPPTYSGTILVSGCNPGATINMLYTGTCSSLNGTGALITIGAGGTGTGWVNLPATCPGAGSAPGGVSTSFMNTWTGDVLLNGNPGTPVSITW